MKKSLAIINWPEKVVKKRIKWLLRLMKNTKDTRMKERFQTILLFLNNYPPEEIASIINRSSSSVYNYINAYLKNGLKGLRLKYPPGRPCFLQEEQQNQVYNTVVFKVPKDVGFPVEMNWTAPLVKKWIEQEFGVAFSVRGVLRLLHSLGLSCTRPTYSLAKADRQKQEEFKKNVCGAENTAAKWVSGPDSLRR
jgi:putative transposase